MVFLYIFFILSVIVFFVAVIQRIIRIASAPVHLRWELYPVPHEKGRAHYGGSRLEEVNWWEKKQEKDHLGEIKVMFPEILFLKGVWDHNRALWIGSFPFHFALYLFSANIFLCILGGIFITSGSQVTYDSAGLAGLLYHFINILAWAGAIIGILGSLRLFIVRIADKNLRLFSTPSHYFNIVLIGAIYLTVFIWLIQGHDFVEGITGFYAGMFTFSAIDMPTIGYWHIIISLLFLIYLPFTHMTHFFTKYFTYHKIRWEDEPNVVGGDIATKVAKYLNQPVTWAAPHIGADGTKNWIAIATSNPLKKEK